MSTKPKTIKRRLLDAVESGHFPSMADLLFCIGGYDDPEEREALNCDVDCPIVDLCRTVETRDEVRDAYLEFSVE